MGSTGIIKKPSGTFINPVYILLYVWSNLMNCLLSLHSCWNIFLFFLTFDFILVIELTVIFHNAWKLLKHLYTSCCLYTIQWIYKRLGMFFPFPSVIKPQLGTIIDSTSSVVYIFTKYNISGASLFAEYSIQGTLFFSKYNIESILFFAKFIYKVYYICRVE